MADQRTKKVLRMKLHIPSSADRIKLTTVEVLGKLRAIYAEREKAGTLPRQLAPAENENENTGKREEEIDVGQARETQRGHDPLGFPSLDDDEAWRICGALAWRLTDDETFSPHEAISRLRTLPGDKRRQLARWLGAKAETVQAVWPEKKLTKNQSVQLVALGGDWLETVLADEGMLAYTLERLQRLDLQALLEFVDD